ncbi:MAG: dTDP-4-dehydrorhamnose 3,5-epimerase [Pyrinomonadaceae bacterium]|nr:dTDP-4-dehydrorhamnose 3,5-epimerase [Pyrinomonadaceae bacterium]
MIFSATKLAGIYLVEPHRYEDGRGFFAPSFSAKAFAERGMESYFVETNISYSRNRGTLRGMHYQAAPHGQAKFVRCTRGAIFDVAVDLRPDSPTFKQWIGFELTAENRFMLYVPGDCAHGFQTLLDDTEVFYMVSQVYIPESSRGVRGDDPAFSIEWPDVGARTLIKRDQEYPDFNL